MPVFVVRERSYPAQIDSDEVSENKQSEVSAADRESVAYADEVWLAETLEHDIGTYKSRAKLVAGA